jgi:hypothetical protein
MLLFLLMHPQRIKKGPFELTLLLVGSMFAKTLFPAEQCDIKMKNAAQEALAVNAGVNVKNIKVLKFKVLWQQKVGHDAQKMALVEVGVTVGPKPNLKSYEVNAEQIGTTSDCRISGVMIHGLK